MTPMRWLTADELEILDLGARAEEAATITFHGNQLRILLAGYRAAKGLRDALERALMQWEMHADNLRYGGVDEPYLADGQDPEAELYREARALLAAPRAAPAEPADEDRVFYQEILRLRAEIERLRAAEGRALDVERLARAINEGCVLHGPSGSPNDALTQCASYVAAEYDRLAAPAEPATEGERPNG